jgi:hypothetical protein
MTQTFATLSQRLRQSDQFLREQRMRRLLQRNIHHEQHGNSLPQIRMIVTPWFIDIADGLQTRVVRAAE